MKNLSGIHPTAMIGDGVTIGHDVSIGPRTIVYDNVIVGDRTKIGADVILGEPSVDAFDSNDYVNGTLSIGANSLIRSGSILYAGSSLGDGLETGHRVTIREGTVAGINWRVGTLSDIQGDCRIGDYVRFHSSVHVGKCSKVGDFVWIFPYVVLTNDPHPPSDEIIGVVVNNFAVIATMSVVLPGVIIGEDSLVGAGSVVTRDVAPEDIVAGNPAKRVGSVREIRDKRTGEAVYPWRYHFDRGMPWAGIGYDAWRAS